MSTRATSSSTHDYDQYQACQQDINTCALVASVVSSILALIPPIRLVGALMLRSCAFIAVTAGTSLQWSQSSLAEKAVNISKIAAVILGIVGLGMGQPMLIIAALACDIGLEALTLAYRCYQSKEGGALSSLVTIVITSLAIAAIATGSWQIMVAAASIHAAAMFVLAYLDDRPANQVCFVLAGLIGIAAATSIAQHTRYKVTDRWYEMKNTTDAQVTYYDREGNAYTAAAGQTLRLPYNIKFVEEPYYTTTLVQHPHVDSQGNMYYDYTYQTIVLHKDVLRAVRSDTGYQFSVDHWQYNRSGFSYISHPPIAAKDLPTVPVGSDWSRFFSREKQSRRALLSDEDVKQPTPVLPSTPLIDKNVMLATAATI